MGVARGDVDYYERRAKNPSVETIHKVAAALGADPVLNAAQEGTTCRTASPPPQLAVRRFNGGFVPHLHSSDLKIAKNLVVSELTSNGEEQRTHASAMSSADGEHTAKCAASEAGGRCIFVVDTPAQMASCQLRELPRGNWLPCGNRRRSFAYWPNQLLSGSISQLGALASRARIKRPGLGDDPAPRVSLLARCLGAFAAVGWGTPTPRSTDPGIFVDGKKAERRKPGPPSQLEEKLVEARKLPRRKQELLVKMIDAFLEAERRSA